jgi:hypothetical protein
LCFVFSLRIRNYGASPLFSPAVLSPFLEYDAEATPAASFTVESIGRNGTARYKIEDTVLDSRRCTRVQRAGLHRGHGAGAQAGGRGSIGKKS